MPFDRSYLPIYLNATIMIGVVRMFMDGRKNVDENKERPGYRRYIILYRYESRRQKSCRYRTCYPCSCRYQPGCIQVVNFGNISGVVLMIIISPGYYEILLMEKKKSLMRKQNKKQKTKYGYQLS